MSYYSIKQIVMRHEGFTESAIRNYIAHEHQNGFSACVFRPGGIRKVLIHEPSFEAWIRGQVQQPQKPSLSSTPHTMEKSGQYTLLQTEERNPI